MNKEILFVCSDQNFLVKALLQNLRNAGFTPLVSGPDVSQLGLMGPLPEVFMVYLEGGAGVFEGALQFLKKQLEDGDSRHVLYLVGTEVEISAAYAVVPRSLVEGVFIRPVNAKAIISTLAPYLPQGDSAVRKSILVIDDDSIMLRTLNNWLGKQYTVYMANSGMAGIALLAQRRVDLILLDYEMPVVSGLQVFEMLKNEPRTASIPVIFLTSKDDREIVIKVLAAKPEKYVLKTEPRDVVLKNIEDFFLGR